MKPDFETAAREAWKKEFVCLDPEIWKDEINSYVELYVAGCEHAYSLPKWISVKDRLPEERLLGVLVFNGDAPEYNQHIWQATWFGQTQTFKREIEGKYMGTITHWQPLPEPPKN